MLIIYKSCTRFTQQIKKMSAIETQCIDRGFRAFYVKSYIWAIAKNDTISHVLTDIELRYEFVPHGEWNLNIETIGKYDSDILFIIDVDRRTPSFYFQHPIFSSLKVVKNNRAYVVSQEKWRSLGISGAIKTLDDLFKYLPKDA